MVESGGREKRYEVCDGERVINGECSFKRNYLGKSNNFLLNLVRDGLNYM